MLMYRPMSARTSLLGRYFAVSKQVPGSDLSGLLLLNESGSFVRN